MVPVQKHWYERPGRTFSYLIDLTNALPQRFHTSQNQCRSMEEKYLSLSLLHNHSPIPFSALWTNDARCRIRSLHRHSYPQTPRFQTFPHCSPNEQLLCPIRPHTKHEFIPQSRTRFLTYGRTRVLGVGTRRPSRSSNTKTIRRFCG